MGNNYKNKSDSINSDIEIPLKRAIFIDGRNFKYATYDSLSLKVDFEKLLPVLSAGRYLIRAYYYSGIWTADSIRSFIALKKLKNEDEKFNEFMDKRERDLAFLRFLNRNGYKVVTKPMKVYRDYTTGEVTVKADLDVELALDMLKVSDYCDEVVMASGDGDFIPVIKEIADKGVRIIVVSTVSESANKKGYRASDELIDEADNFVDIEEIREEIERGDGPEY